jgi:hypothetical protein
MIPIVKQYLNATIKHIFCLLCDSAIFTILACLFLELSKNQDRIAFLVFPFVVYQLLKVMLIDESKVMKEIENKLK